MALACTFARVLTSEKGILRFCLLVHLDQVNFLLEQFYPFIQFVHSDLSVYANQIKNVSNKFLKNDNNKSRLFDVSKSLENMTYLDHWMQSIK